jgi:hypothetical protein
MATPPNLVSEIPGATLGQELILRASRSNATFEPQPSMRSDCPSPPATVGLRRDSSTSNRADRGLPGGYFRSQVRL